MPLSTGYKMLQKKCNLKAYSQISYKGHFQKVQNLNFLHLFEALLQNSHISTKE